MGNTKFQNDGSPLWVKQGVERCGFWHCFQSEALAHSNQPLGESQQFQGKRPKSTETIHSIKTEIIQEKIFSKIQNIFRCI